MNTRNKEYVVLGPLMGVVAMVLYCFTLSRGAFPGESANLMAAALGVDPLGYSGHTLWNWAVDLLIRLPIGPVSFRLNIFSSLCAAGAVGLLFRILADAVWDAIPITDVNVRAINRASVLAGLVGSTALMGCIPFWYVANRFHPASFDILLLCVLAKLLLTFMRRASVSVGLVLAFLYGASASEFATLIIFGPLVLVCMLYVLWINGDLHWRRILSLAGCLLAGMLVYFPAARHLQLSDVYQLSQNNGFLYALFLLLKGQYLLISKSLPSIGWLLVVLIGILPWLAVLVVWSRSLNEEKDWGLFVLHLVLTGVVIAALFNVPFAPWRILGASRLLVTPYVLLAFTLGYLAAYWSLSTRVFWRPAEDDEPFRRWHNEHGGLFPAGLLLVTAITIVVVNFHEADARPAGSLNEYARAVAKACKGREWLVTDGVLDSNIKVAARELGVELKIFNLQMGNNALYMRSMAREFEDARMKSLAEVDGFAFVRQWMETDVHFARKVAFLSLPDLWLAASLKPVPECMIFSGIQAVSDLDAGALWSRHEEFWKAPFIGELQAIRKTNPLLGPRADYVVKHLSMVANNLGVLLEDAGWRQQAYRAYAKARDLDRNNISSLLNQRVMIEHGYATPEAQQVKDDFDEFTRTLKQKFQIWSLSRVYGYVRMPEAYASMGMAWAYSGQPGLAVEGFNRAIELAPERKDQLSQGLAMAYLAQDQTVVGEGILKQLLEKDPFNERVLMSLSRLAVQKNKFKEASTLLDRAQKAGVSKDRITMEYAIMNMAAGEPDKARAILQGLVDLHPDLTDAWAMLAAVMIQQNDMKAIEECERNLTRTKDQDFITLIVLAEIALRRTQFANARAYIDHALAMKPNSAALLDLLLRLDVQEGRRDLAMTHVRTLLTQDSGHPFANQVLASLQLERKEYAQAESSLLKSLERKKDPLVMNDLAWVYEEMGDLDKAETYVKEALKADSKFGNAWDTLAMIKMKRGKFKEAHELFTKALALFPDNLSIQVHLIQNYDASGNKGKAVELADSLLAHPVGLGQDDIENLRRISRSLMRR